MNEIIDCKNKIIYISFIRLTDKVARDWYVEFCIEKGAKVEFWDIVSLVREEHNEKGMINEDYLKTIKSYDELEKLISLENNLKTVYVMLITYTGKYVKPYLILSKYKCKMVLLSWGAMPASKPLTTHKIPRRISNFIKSPIKYSVMVGNILKGRFYRSLNLVRQYEVIFAAGNQLTSTAAYTKKIISINLMDYENFISQKNKKIIATKGKYVVFIDANAPYHSDNKIAGLKNLDAKEYFKSLNKFFDVIEEKYNINVVIAGNPKSEYEGEVYDNRLYYRLKTAELIQHAEFVLLHQSTALSYAILNHKPVIFLYTDQMKELYGNTIIPEIENLANYLKASIYNINEIENNSMVKISEVDLNIYNNYKYNYITSKDSEKFRTQDIFWTEICKI